jgi:D-xylose transport system permease protein
MAKVEEPETGALREPARADDVNVRGAEAAVRALAPELAGNSIGDYARAWWSRVKSGESGVLPVVIGLVAISIIFQIQNSKFLSSENLTNLLIQAAAFMLLGMGEVYALLLGEIDLSIGFVSGIGGIVTAELVKTSTWWPGDQHWPWWAAIAVALIATFAIGLLQGTLITRLRLPSFIVTLAGLLFWQGVMLRMLGKGGTVPIQSEVINDIAGGHLSPLAGWVVAIVVVAGFALYTVTRDVRRRRSGLVAPPMSLTGLKIATVAAAAVVLLLICNADRGALTPVRGVPWVVLVVLLVLTLWTILLGRTRFGRYVYAIGANPEAARRAGVNLTRIRTVAFGLASMTAGIGGIVYASRLRSVSTSLDGGTLVLYAVATAVIGGTSLFGGRGKALHPVLGGVVIAAIYNGMGLLGMSAAAQYMITALVLLAAVTVDAVARRGRAVASAQR